MNTPNFTSDVVKQYATQLKLTNDFYNGFESAKEHIKKYTKESNDNYAIRKDLARLSNFTREAIATVPNMLLRKPTIYDESVLDVYMDNIDLNNNLDTFLHKLITNVAKDGYTYLLVEKQDYNDVQNGADELSKRPYLLNIPRQSVRNFKQTDDGTFRQFTFDENYVVDDGYAEVTYTQQRCYLEDGTVEIWRENELYETIQNGLGYVPVIKIGDENISRFYDLAIINRNHFNLKSEQRNYARIAAAPIPTTNMLNTDGEITTIGISDGINFDSPKNEASFQWVELSGTSNAMLESLIIKDEEDMRRYITTLSDSDIQRTAKESSLLNINNQSILSYFAGVTEDAMNKALQIMAEYQGIKNFEANLKINKDFIDTKLMPEEIAQYKDLYINGVIDWDTFVTILVNGEILNQMDDNQKNTMKVNLIQNAG